MAEPGVYSENFVLVAAMNPCPCGYDGDPIKPCTCAPSTVTKYQQGISGPLLDRIDIHVEVPRVDYQKLSDDRVEEASAVIRARVENAPSYSASDFTGIVRRQRDTPQNVGRHRTPSRTSSAMQTCGRGAAPPRAHKVRREVKLRRCTCGPRTMLA